MVRRLVLATVLVAAAASVVTEQPAEAAPAKARTECVAEVIGQKASGELELAPMRCYRAFAEAMEAEGVGHWGEGASERAAVSGLSFVLGRHCDFYNLVSPCFDVTGTSCIGGWLSLSGNWYDNRISSTQNGCPTIRHFDGYALNGAFKSTSCCGIHNLTTFNNVTSSIQYL